MYIKDIVELKKIGNKLLIIMSQSEFNALAGENTALLGLDVGSKTIGIAVSGALRISATPLYTIMRKKLHLDAKMLFSYYDDYECKGLIIGWPLEMDGTVGRRCQSVRDFTLELLKIRDVPVYFFDERLSSWAAEDMLINIFDASRKKREKSIDKIAAAVILDGAITQLKKGL